MPNPPLQTFRAVEPAHFGFAAASTLASQPFVLYHERGSAIVGEGSPTANSVSAFAMTYPANRFQPWDWRLNDACFPVKVPNAYDRIHIFPMYIATSSAGVSGDVSFGTVSTSYNAPFIMPFGLAPQTRGFTTANRLNPELHRLPDDILAKLGVISSFNSRNDGIWNVLPPYASNFSTSHGLLAIGSPTNPTSFGRHQTGTGTGFALPDDLSISNANTGVLSESQNRWNANSKVLIGMGQDFQTFGSEEIVVAPGSAPTGLTISHVGTLGVTYRIEYFLMGTFLG